MNTLLNYKISNLESNIEYSALRALFGENVESQEGIQVIYLGDIIIGFYQIVPLNMQSFIKGHELEDYDLSLISEKEYLQFRNLFLVDEYQNHGIGTEIVQHIKNETCKPLILYSLATAEEFWLKQGFEELDTYVFTFKK